MEYIVNPEDIYLDDIAELSDALKASDFARINTVLCRCVTDADGEPVTRIKATHAVKLAKRIIETITSDELGN